MKNLLYRGIAVHFLCKIHGLKSGVIPEPDPEPEFVDGVCTVCQVEGPKDHVQKVARPVAWGGMREVNSGIDTGFRIE